MPILPNQQVPPQTPPGQTPPVSPPPSANPLLDILMNEYQRVEAAKEHPWRTAFGDIGTVLKSLIQDVPNYIPTHQMMIAHGTALVDENMRAKLAQADVTSPLDLVRTGYKSGVFAGLTFGAEHLPFVGEAVNAKLSPVQARLDQDAALNLRTMMMAMDGNIGRATFAELPTALGQIGGTLTGAAAQFVPFARLGRIAMGLPTAFKGVKAGQAFTEAIAAAQVGYIGDIAGFGLYGALTEERGILAAGGRAVTDDDLLAIQEDPGAPFWKRALIETVNRTTAAGQMAAEGFTMVALLDTGLNAMTRLPMYERAKVAALRGQLAGQTDIVASDILAARGILTDPGMRRQVKINDPGTAGLVVDLRATEELVNRSTKALKLLSEQQAVEGVVSYQSGIAALATAVYDLSVADHAGTVVLRNIDDPYRMYSDVFRKWGDRASTTPPDDVKSELRRLGLLKQARTDLEGASEHRIRATDTAIKTLESGIEPPTMMQQIRKQPVPLVHGKGEVPTEGLFGYIEGASTEPLLGVAKQLDPNQPLFLRARPNITAADLGRVEEAVVLPGKSASFIDYDDLLAKYGTLDDAWSTLRKRKVDTAIVERGGAGEREIIVLDHSIIKSSKPVTPELIAAQPPDMDDAIQVLRSLANEPLEVALSKRMPDFVFETPVKREDGTYDIVFRRRGAPGMSNAQRKQFRDTGWFSGQSVFYAGKQYEFGSLVGKHKAKIINKATGEEHVVRRSSLIEYPSASVEMPVDEAIYKEFTDYFDRKLGLIYDRQIGEKGLKDLAKKMENPSILKRDLSGQHADIMLYPDEVMTSVEINKGLQLQAEAIIMELQAIPPSPENGMRIMELQSKFAEIQQMIKAEVPRPVPEPLKNIDDAYVTFPDPLDYYTLIFKRFLEEKNIRPESVGQLDAMKFSFARRMQQDLFKRMPKDVRAQYSKMEKELQEAWDSLPDTLENRAKLAGLEVVRTKDGSILFTRPGSNYYEGVYTSEPAAQAALGRSLRYAGAPNLTPQWNWLDFSLPSGPGLGATPGSIATDMHFFNNEKVAGYLAGTEDLPAEFTKGKPNWFLKLGDRLGVPLWTEYVEPIFNQRQHAGNFTHVYSTPMIEASQAVSLAERKQIGEFMRTLDNQAEFIDAATRTAKAKAFGLNSAQIKWIDEYRKASDELFALGMKWYGWTPQDYMFNYFTRMRPQHMVAGDGRKRQYTFLPKDMDIFMSKYGRDGAHMLADLEDDPLTVYLKYVRTFAHEHYVAPSYERLRSFIDIKFKDLSPDKFERVRQLMPAGKRGNIAVEDHALPPAARGPINEMLLTLRGYPQGNDDVVTEIVHRMFDKMGVKVDRGVVAEAANTLIGVHYGATMALRGRPVVRNTVSNLSTLMPRVGTKAYGEGFNRAVKNMPEAVSKAIDEGIINIQSKGVALGEELVMQLLDEAPVKSKHLGGAILGGLFQAALVQGKLPKAIRWSVEKGLKGITNTDHWSRVVAAEVQEAYTRPFVEKFLNGKITEEQMLRQGLRYWEPEVKRKFAKLLNDEGSEAAIRYIRKAGADLTNYDYAIAAQPAWSQRPLGRMANMYGRWAMWYKDLQMRNFRNASSNYERGLLAVRSAMVAGGLAGVGLQLGLDMQSWMAHNSVLTYGGGPIVRMFADAVNVMENNSYEYKAQAIANLARQNIMRTAFPGQMFFEDAKESLQMLDYPNRAILNFFIGRTSEDINAWGLDIMDMMESSGALGSPPQTNQAPSPSVLPGP